MNRGATAGSPCLVVGSGEGVFDAAAQGVPVIFGEDERFVGIVATRDHDEVATVEVDVPLQTMLVVPSDLAVAADDVDEVIMRSSVGSGVIEPFRLVHARASVW
jgi:hypothetical protein